MELSLSRVDLLQVSSTSRNTLRLLPLSKRSTQKVVVGDNSGCLHCFGVRKGEAAVSFTTNRLSKEITALSLGGGEKGNNFVFAASGRKITGFTRKGRTIYEFPSPHTEDIKGLQVIQQEERIFAAGDFVLAEFCKGQEENYFMSSDKINCMFMQKPGNSFEAVLACQDRRIRIVSCGISTHEIGVEGPATAVSSFDTNSDFDQEFRVEDRQQMLGRLDCEIAELKAKLTAASDGESAQFEEELRRKERELLTHTANGAHVHRDIVFGTENGKVGVLSLVEDGLRPGWCVSNLKRLGGVNCMSTCDITKDGRTDILVGRDDGTLEAWSCDAGAEPSLVFSRCINESISSVDCGVITTGASEDVIISSFSGKVIVFSSAVADNEPGAPAYPIDKPGKAKTGPGQGTIKHVHDKDIAKLNAELEMLRSKLLREKGKYLQAAEKHGGSTELIATTNNMRLKESFVLDLDDACHIITVEIESPIDCVIVQSTAAVELVDIESNVAIVSQTKIDEATSLQTKMLATFRCQEPTRRMQIKLRTTEGIYGELVTYVVSALSPKTCQSIKHQLKALSLHTRIQDSLQRDDAEVRLKLHKLFGSAVSYVACCGCTCYYACKYILYGRIIHY